MRSKLFTPAVRPKETSVDDASERPDMFVNVPVHPDVPVFTGNTDTDGKACYPLRLSPSRGGPNTKPLERRGVRSRNTKIDY